MLEALITSKTRIKLMLKFFLNSTSTGYLRGLASEFGESTNSVRPELNRFEEAGLITSSTEGMKKVFQANTKHPLFSDINSLVRKYVGMDKLVDNIITHPRRPQRIVPYRRSGPRHRQPPDLNMIIVGEKIDLDYLKTLVAKAQMMISRKIGYAVFTTAEFELQYPHINQEKLLPVWKNTD
jgi:hypothetical protein